VPTAPPNGDRGAHDAGRTGPEDVLCTQAFEIRLSWYNEGIPGDGGRVGEGGRYYFALVRVPVAAQLQAAPCPCRIEGGDPRGVRGE